MSPASRRRISTEDLYHFQLISSPRLSPDGKHVVYSLSRVDSKTEKKYANLWIVPTNSGNPRQFTYGDQSDSTPEWSPDGKQIAFLSNRGNQEKPAQIYIIPFDGGEAHPLSNILGEIESFSWHPNGKQILCDVRKTDIEDLERDKDEQKKKLGIVVRHYDRLFYKLDGFGYLPHERIHIWTVDTNNGQAEQITDHPVWDDLNPAWSPDGRWITFLSNRQPDPDANLDAVDLFVMSASGGEPRKIPTPPGEKSLPNFSPDGKWIAYYAKEGEGLEYKNTGLWVVPADGTHPPRNLTESYDLEVSS
jgi:Tol biopolymer transport system component